MTTTGKHGKQVNASKGVQGFHETRRAETDRGLTESVGVPVSPYADKSLAEKIESGSVEPSEAMKNPTFGPTSARAALATIVHRGDVLSTSDLYLVAKHPNTPEDVLDEMDRHMDLMPSISATVRSRLGNLRVTTEIATSLEKLDKSRERITGYFDRDTCVPSHAISDLLYQQVTADLWRQVEAKTSEDVTAMDALVEVADAEEKRLVHGRLMVGQRQLLTAADSAEKQATGEATVDFVRAARILRAEYAS